MSGFKEYYEDSVSKRTIRGAEEFAREKHNGQTRRDGSEYVSHPIRVAGLVKRHKRSHQLHTLRSAAMLHDTVEDTNTTVEEIRKVFGDTVADLVQELTTDEKEKNLLGKTNYLIKKMSTMSDWGLVIKLCDRLDNVSDLRNANNQKFADKYAKETKEIISYLLHNRKLTGTQRNIINQIQKKLSQLKKINTQFSL